MKNKLPKKLIIILNDILEHKQDDTYVFEKDELKTIKKALRKDKKEKIIYTPFVFYDSDPLILLYAQLDFYKSIDDIKKYNNTIDEINKLLPKDAYKLNKRIEVTRFCGLTFYSI